MKSNDDSHICIGVHRYDVAYSMVGTTCEQNSYPCKTRCEVQVRINYINDDKSEKATTATRFLRLRILRVYFVDYKCCESYYRWWGRHHFLFFF